MQKRLLPILQNPVISEEETDYKCLSDPAGPEKHIMGQDSFSPIPHKVKNRCVNEKKYIYTPVFIGGFIMLLL